MNAKDVLQAMTLKEKAAFCSGKDFWQTKPIPRLDVPSVFMCDGPHGLRKQLGEGDHLGINASIETVCYPTAAALASSFDRDVMRRLGKALGEECQAEHVAMLLGPGLNIKRSPLCGRNFEYFSEDPYLAGEMGEAYVEALQNEGVAACAKHFACNNQETRRMSGSSQVDERTLREIYLPAFEKVVKGGKVRSLMCAYNGINEVFCAENKELLTDILRNDWSFDGFVVTDWGAVKDRAQGIAAGLDLEMPGGPGADGSEILKAIQKGTLTEAELDRAVLRLLEFVLTSAKQQNDNAAVDREACRKLAAELAGECAVLMKNDGLLPLSETQNIAFIGEFASAPRYQGAGSSHINVPHAVSAREYAEGKHILYAQGYDVHRPDAPELVEEALETARAADVAVIFAGLPDAFESEGADRTHMRLPDNQNALIEAVLNVNPNTVVVLHGGSPVELPWLHKVKALLCMYLGGERTGEAAVKLLFGEISPSGHLAETWPIRLQDTPCYLNFPGEDGLVKYAEDIFVGYRYYDKKEMPVNFPFGHGLSYTSFDYTDLSLGADKIRDTDSLTVSVRVKNTGKCAGRTAVQLYVRDLKSTVRRPVRELKGFEKVMLAPREETVLTFTLDKRAFAYWDVRCHDWFVESGDYIIEIGESSRKILCSAPVYVEGTVELSFTITKNTTIGQLMKHPKGSAFVRRMTAKSSGPSQSEQAEAMGEGSEAIMHQMMLDMPLGSLVSYGRMTAEQLETMIRNLNE